MIYYASMTSTPDWTRLASDESIAKTVAALKANGITVLVAENGAAAKEQLFKILPAGAEVMTMTSVTLDTIGATAEINESGKYASIRAKFKTMDKKIQGLEMNRLGAAPDWAVGSVHAVTEDGIILVASNTGSQLSAYAYGANHAIWVVGSQKLVATEELAKRRLYEHVLPLESERAKKAYGVLGSFVSKLLTLHREVNPSRLTMIIVKEQLGF